MSDFDPINQITEALSQVLSAAEHAFLADETLSAALSRVNAQPQNRRSRERSREVTPAA